VRPYLLLMLFMPIDLQFYEGVPQAMTLPLPRVTYTLSESSLCERFPKGCGSLAQNAGQHNRNNSRVRKCVDVAVRQEECVPR
jgi:hypothetical protein